MGTNVKETGRSFAINLMDHLVVPTFVLGTDGRVIIWNKACHRLTGLAPEDVIGTKDHWRAFYEKPRACLADVISEGRMDELGGLYETHTDQNTGHQGVSAENWCVMPCASKRLYLAIDAGPIYDASGQLVAVVETLRDMTDQKVAEIELQKLANQDGLTGLANRRAFDLAIEDAIRHGQRTEQPVALLLGDVDHFKKYNDIYGHQSGDECLITIAEAISKQVGRSMDLAARYGGEEFAVVLQTAKESDALMLAERIRQAIYDLNLPHKENSAADRVTLSMGVATCVPTAKTNPTQFIETADRGLYAAKEAGRNTVLVEEWKASA